MATTETNTPTHTATNAELGRQIVEDAKRYVLYSWSVQDAINPIAVERAEGRYFWDYDGKRYLDFASQLVNVSIGHAPPEGHRRRSRSRPRRSRRSARRWRPSRAHASGSCSRR